jgi:hypothetical protein
VPRYNAPLQTILKDDSTVILDSCKIEQLIFQIRYPLAMELWDTAGRVNRRVRNIWPDTEVVSEHVTPAQIILKGPKVQIDTGITQSTISLRRPKTIEQSSQQIVDTYAAWRSELSLTELTRVSTRVLYVKDYPTILEANKELFALGLCRYPTMKVFDQPVDSPKNTVDIQYRFEDETSFAFLRLHSQEVKIEFKVTDEFTALKDVKDISETRNRFIIDFDRGLKSSIRAASFRMDEWIKGFSHILRRDLEKVLKE